MARSPKPPPAGLPSFLLPFFPFRRRLEYALPKIRLRMSDHMMHMLMSRQMVVNAPIVI